MGRGLGIGGFVIGREMSVPGRAELGGGWDDAMSETCRNLFEYRRVQLCYQPDKLGLVFILGVSVRAVTDHGDLCEVLREDFAWRDFVDFHDLFYELDHDTGFGHECDEVVLECDHHELGHCLHNVFLLRGQGFGQLLYV